MSTLGSKADNLHRLINEFGLSVPDFEAIPFDELITDYLEVSKSLCDKVDRFLSGVTTLEQANQEIEKILQSVSIAENRALERFERLSGYGWHKVSFRTSALLEDGAKDSFAGQYQSFLDIDLTAQAIEQYTLKCFESMLSAQLINYAKSRGLQNFKLGGSVVVQKMFYGKSSGVLFSENGSGEIQIAISDSWLNSVVEGESAREVKLNRFELDKAKLPWQIKELCKQALEIERRVGTPVDIEWAFDEKEIAYLQFRPISQPMLDFSFEWDSTNISENYPGITLPLTYSVIRQFYGAVYLNFFRMLGAKEKDITAAAPITENMLGYLDGRVYYRITNWYEAIKLMPGKRNQEYFEAMLNPVRKRGKAEMSRLDLKSLITLVRFASLLMRSERISRRFSQDISKKIALYDTVPFDYINAATILESGKRIRREFLEDWAVTILNDVRLMISHGVLQRMYSKSENPQAYLNLIQGLQDRASIRPLQQLTKLGQIVAAALTAERLSSPDQLEGSKSWPEVRRVAQEYISEFGARTPGELKLENERLTDQIFTVLELALKSANSGISASPSTAKREFEWPTGISVLARPLVLLVAKSTRRAIDWRERFRFNRAQTFNITRKAFDAIGKTLAAEGIIQTPRDIYWLTDAEVEDLVGAHAPILDAKDLIAARKLAFEGYAQKEKTLAVRGSGRLAGMHQSNVEVTASENGLTGNGVAPGEITAEVIVLEEFDAKADVRGKILVVHYIDPGWTLLFTQAAGIIAERGNALSHAAIISREIGIPAIVAAVGATKLLKTGQTVKVNGTTGVISDATL